MSNKYKIKGHETFGIREGWINKGIAAVHDNPKVFSENAGADALGVGTNMAKAIRYWLRTAGLIENRKDGSYLTKFGRLVYDMDPYIENIFTLWIIHIHIAVNKELATSWYLFFKTGTLNEFTRDVMFVEMKHLLEIYTEKEDLSERSINDDCTVLLHMYGNVQSREDPEEKKKSPFSELGLLKQEGKWYKKTTPKLQYLSPCVVWYVLNIMLQKNGQISIQNLLEAPESPGKILQLGRVELNHYLDILEEQGVITVNRTAGLDMVYEKKKEDSLDIVRQYYDSI